MIWSSLIKSHRHGSHQREPYCRWFLPQFSQILRFLTTHLLSSSSGSPLRYFSMFSSPLSSLTPEGHAQTPVPSRNPRRFRNGRCLNRAFSYSVKVSKQAGLEPAEKDTNGAPGCSNPAQRRTPLLNPIPFFVSTPFPNAQFPSKDGSPTDLVQFRGGIENRKPEAVLPTSGCRTIASAGIFCRPSEYLVRATAGFAEFRFCLSVVTLTDCEFIGRI